LLLEGGSLDKVRTWDGEGEWENRVSSLTAENVAWLDSKLASSFIGLELRTGIGVWKYIKHDRSCPVNEMIVRVS
jgi:ubiquinone biosynthesis monooxygenase Coq6